MIKLMEYKKMERRQVGAKNQKSESNSGKFYSVGDVNQSTVIQGEHITYSDTSVRNDQVDIGDLNMTNEGDVYNIGQAAAVGRYARSDNNTLIQSEQKKTLAEAAEEIQNLLRQLEQVNPAATETEKIAYVNYETTPSLKHRVVGALQAGGETAIEEFLDNPYVNVGKAIVKGWMKPE